MDSKIFEAIQNQIDTAAPILRRITALQQLQCAHSMGAQG